MRRILHISKYYWPIVGGIEDVCYNVVSMLKHSSEQYVLSVNNTSASEDSVVDGVAVRRSGSLGVVASQPISLRLFWDLRKILRKFDPEVVTLHLPNPLVCLYVLLLWNRKRKLIVHWHSDIVVYETLYKMIRPLEDRVLKLADKVIVTSPNYLHHSDALSPYKDKCVIIPNVISPKKLELANPEAVETVKARYGNKPIVFFLGRHVEYKGLRYLIESAPHLNSECVILIAGSGPLTEQLKKSASDERIVFLGRIADEDIPVYMHAADIFAFPSITKNEAFGVALAEAMYCKAVPVTFNIPCSGVNWVNLKDETGLEVANKDSVAYGKAIDELIKYNSQRNILAENAHSRVVELFMPDSIKNDLYRLYL